VYGCERSVLIARKRTYFHDGGHREWAVDVGELLGAAFEVFLDEFTSQPRRIDFEQHEVGSSTKEAIRGWRDLVIRAMDKTFAVKSFGCVFSNRQGGSRLLLRGNVVNPGVTHAFVAPTMKKRSFAAARHPPAASDMNADLAKKVPPQLTPADE